MYQGGVIYPTSLQFIIIDLKFNIHVGKKSYVFPRSIIRRKIPIINYTENE